MVSRPNEKKVDHVPRLFTTTRGRKHTFSTTLSHPKMSLFAALARRVATQISTSTMSSWCTADDTSALSASGLAQSASKFPSSRVPSALISGAPGFSGNHATSFDPDPRPCARLDRSPPRMRREHRSFERRCADFGRPRPGSPRRTGALASFPARIREPGLR